ncbi:hypothetical protein QYF36_002513 [Acer negundo]|nr:hypothetical protein QYF36_002513 [Acer negundo]
MVWGRLLVLIPAVKGCPDKIKVINSRFSTTLTVEEDPLLCYKGDTHQNFRGDRNDNGWSYVEAVKGNDIVKDSKKKEMVVKMEEMY